MLSQGGPRDAAVISIHIEFYNGIVQFLCHSTALSIQDISARSNAEITQSTLIFTAMTQNQGDSRKSRYRRYTTGKSHDDRYYRRYR